MKKQDKTDMAGCYDDNSISPNLEEQKKAVTIEEIKEYIDDFPYELLTSEEEEQVRDEIVTWKNGGCVLDGITVELRLKSIDIHFQKNSDKDAARK